MATPSLTAAAALGIPDPSSPVDQVAFLGTATSEGVPRVSCLVQHPMTCVVCAKAVGAEDSVEPVVATAQAAVSGSGSDSCGSGSGSGSARASSGGAALDGGANDGAAGVAPAASTTSPSVPSTPASASAPRSKPKPAHAPISSRHSRNRRGNTGCMIRRWDAAAERHINIMIDCGKLWWQTAIDWFPRLGIDAIDAVILTHEHFDATGGLDSIRDFTRPPIMLPGQQLPVYLTQDTFDTVESMFPYLTDTSKATGSGEVPRLRFQIVRPHEPFVVAATDVTVHSFLVEHGPNYFCGAFRIGDFVWASDVSAIPDEARPYFRGARTVVMDALWKRPECHKSHFGLEQAIKEHVGGYGFVSDAEAAAAVPKRPVTLCVGMNHTLDHDVENALLVERGYPDMALAYDGLVIDCVDLTAPFKPEPWAKPAGSWAPADRWVDEDAAVAKLLVETEPKLAAAGGQDAPEVSAAVAGGRDAGAS